MTRKHSSQLRGGIAILLALGLVGVVAAPASAANHQVEGTLSCIGDISQYGTFRTHAQGGASLRVTSFTSISDGGVNYGLRNRAGTQVTKSVNFKRADLNKTKKFSSTSGSSTIPAGNLAVNARHITKNTGCGYPLPSWKGTLTL